MCEMDNTKKSKFASWHKRTWLEKILILLIIFITLIVLFLSLRLILKLQGSTSNVCMTEKCIRTAASILGNMESKLDPCDDFYKFACGKFIENENFPDDSVVVTTATGVSDNLLMRLREILEEDTHKTDPKYVKILKTVYSMCMNTTRIEQEGLTPMQNILKDLGGWPVVEGNNWNERDFDWKKLLYRLRRIGLRQNVFFQMYIGTDLKNSSKRIFTISQGCFPQDQLKNETYVKHYHELLTDVAVIYGADPKRATTEMGEVMKFLKEMANISIPNKDRKNATLEYNLIQIKDLEKEYPSIPWLQFINSYLAPHERMYPHEYVNVGLPKFLRKVEALIKKTDKRILANYILYLAQSSVTTALPENLIRRTDEFGNKVWGRSVGHARWKTCVWQTYSLNIGLSAVYIRHFFNKSSKRKVVELVSDIKSSFHETLTNIGWMDKETKKHALIKTDKMASVIGYPEEIMYDDRVDEEYKELYFNPEGRFMDIKINLSLFYHSKHVKELREPVVRQDWRDYAYTFYINAFYNQQPNTIEIPAGILQAPFFDEDRPQYVNYGAIGFVIGHEITHGFDDSGRQYDYDGNLVDWWDPHTNKTFANKAECLVEQYKNYTVPELGMNLNGVNNLGENIADNGGIMIAYRGYQKWIERNGDSELSLPGLPYNAKQMFWISAAYPFCAKYKKETLKNLITSGQHAPWHYRVIVPFMNSEAFAKDFNCPVGSPMNPAHKCRVW